MRIDTLLQDIWHSAETFNFPAFSVDLKQDGFLSSWEAGSGNWMYALRRIADEDLPRLRHVMNNPSSLPHTTTHTTPLPSRIASTAHSAIRQASVTQVPQSSQAWTEVRNV